MRQIVRDAVLRLGRSVVKPTATGSLYLINPQGIVVGPSGVVSTGGRFVASTLDICNDAFINGGDALTLAGKSDASVVNLGRISSSGGDVFLIARQAVVNAGTVKAPSGTVELAAGETVLMSGETGTVMDALACAISLLMRWPAAAHSPPPDLARATRARSPWE
uniref:two-partner secretion domain-containing protein n=1 Tax=Paraburkholderia kirstenboschensis TaxID=1245436 RepID=UPI003741F0E2